MSRRTSKTPAEVIPSSARWGRILLLLPALIVMALLLVGGLIQLANLAFSPYEAGSTGTGFTGDNLRRFADNAYNWQLLASTLLLSALCAIVATTLGYVMALAISRLRGQLTRAIALTLVFAPLLTSVVVRAYGWSVLLGDGGVLNRLLLDLGAIDTPLRLMYDYPAVIIAMTHVLLPFAVFPLLGVIGQVKADQIEAASDLGASRTQVFGRVMFPLTFRGVVLTFQLTFALTTGAFATPSLLGGGRVEVITAAVHQNIASVDWPLAAVQSFALLLSALVVIALTNILARRRSVVTS